MSILLKNKLAALTDTIVSAYDNGATLAQIANIHDASIGTVRSLLIAKGVSLRPRGRPKKYAASDGRVLESPASPDPVETSGYEGSL